jgi:hypothetical protein
MIFIKNNDHNYYWSLIKSNKTNLWFIKDKDQIFPLSHQSQNSKLIFNQYHNCNTTIGLPVHDMYHLSIRSGHPVVYWAQLWLSSPEWDKFYDCNKNLKLDVRNEACLWFIGKYLEIYLFFTPGFRCLAVPYM